MLFCIFVIPPLFYIYIFYNSVYEADSWKMLKNSNVSVLQCICGNGNKL